MLCADQYGAGISVLWIWIVAGAGLAAAAFIPPGLKQRWKIRNRLMKTAVSAGAILFCLYFFLVELGVLICLPSQGKENLDYIIVLGAAVYGTEPSPVLQKRLETAAAYLKRNQDTVVIVSGGQGPGEDISEAGCMETFLLEEGICKSRIIREEKSETTVENIRFSGSHIQEQEASVGIVSSNFHIFRAVVTARSNGLKHACGIAAPFGGLLLPHYAVREFLTFTFDLISGNLI